jgi:hypothetical protein
MILPQTCSLWHARESKPTVDRRLSLGLGSRVLVREVGLEAAGTAPKTPRRRRVNRSAWNRQRVCSDCGKVDTVRKDNPAEVCVRCSNRRKRPPGSPPVTPKARIIVSCEGCGVTFERIPSQPSHRFCSRPCYLASKRIERVCKECGKQFSVSSGRMGATTNSTANFCCRPCYNKWLCRTDSGPARGSGWHGARKEALRRNPFCAVCGRMSRLDVHHIIPYRLTKDNGQDNLVPLCRRHHKVVETAFLEIESAVGGDLITAKLVLRTQIKERQNATRFVLRELVLRARASGNWPKGRAVANWPTGRIRPKPSEE